MAASTTRGRVCVWSPMHSRGSTLPQTESNHRRAVAVCIPGLVNQDAVLTESPKCLAPSGFDHGGRQLTGETAMSLNLSALGPMHACMASRFNGAPA